MLLSYFLVVVNSITAPLFAKYSQQQQWDEFLLLAKNATNILIIVATACAVFIYFFAKTIVLFFGVQYLEAVDIITVLLVGQWVNLATGPVVTMLVMSGYEKLHRKNTIVIAAMTLLLLLILIPKYGVFAAAWITSLSMAVRNFVSWYYCKKHLISTRASF